MPRNRNALGRTWPEWERWLARADPRVFTRLLPGVAARSDGQLARAKKIADAALWLLWQDTVGRAVPNDGRSPNDLKSEAANPLNIETVNIARLLADLGNHAEEKEFIGADARTITNIWANRHTLAEDLIEYLFNGGAYEEEFDAWRGEVLDRVANSDAGGVSFSDAVSELAVAYLTSRASSSPLRELGAMVAATLPQYPHARDLYTYREWRRFDQWCDMVRGLSRLHDVKLDHARAQALVQTIYPFLLGAESLARLRGREP